MHEHPVYEEYVHHDDEEHDHHDYEEHEYEQYDIEDHHDDTPIEYTQFTHLPVPFESHRHSAPHHYTPEPHKEYYTTHTEYEPVEHV